MANAEVALDALGDPTRRRILDLLRGDERSVRELTDALDVSQSAVSQHLAKFKAYGIVGVRRDNQTLYYSLSDKPEVKVLRRVGLGGIEAT